ncbi:hypothetical protein [Aromatoleum anaerobium]|uniref:Uncharacterized protein n=1 Tax=Aromatoleum anaerobium TaxID=182180 RepID=A0ABX1PHH6_9RHOO|nr:hypothetical protein [Aromatoleum anaerobium]
MIWTPTAAQTYYASYSYAFLPSGEQLSLALSASLRVRFLMYLSGTRLCREEKT